MGRYPGHACRGQFQATTRITFLLVLSSARCDPSHIGWRFPSPAHAANSCVVGLPKVDPLPAERQSISSKFSAGEDRRAGEKTACPNTRVETRSCRRRCEKIRSLSGPSDRAIQEWPIPHPQRCVPVCTPSPPPQIPPRTSRGFTTTMHAMAISVVSPASSSVRTFVWFSEM
jgi:hypothetical protein